MNQKAAFLMFDCQFEHNPCPPKKNTLNTGRCWGLKTSGKPKRKINFILGGWVPGFICRETKRKTGVRFLKTESHHKVFKVNLCHFSSPNAGSHIQSFAGGLVASCFGCRRSLPLFEGDARQGPNKNESPYWLCAAPIFWLVGIIICHQTRPTLPRSEQRHTHKPTAHEPKSIFSRCPQHASLVSNPHVLLVFWGSCARCHPVLLRSVG